MKIRCGSHQQNRSIVRPGLSLMATKVALTAEEFRENSQRSIALFNTEKLSTDSTHVLKSAYCILCISAVAICTERVEAKAFCATHPRLLSLQSARSVWRQRHSAQLIPDCFRCNLHGACGGKVHVAGVQGISVALQSARSVWRQRSRVTYSGASCARCNLHGACGGKDDGTLLRFAAQWLQSARSVWRQRTTATLTTR